MFSEIARKDIHIEEAARNRMRAAFLEAGINVRVLQGKVYLVGAVPSLKDKMYAERAILGLAGVKCVINQVRIVPTTQPVPAWQPPIAPAMTLDCGQTRDLAGAGAS